MKKGHFHRVFSRATRELKVHPDSGTPSQQYSQLQEDVIIQHALQGGDIPDMPKEWYPDTAIAADHLEGVSWAARRAAERDARRRSKSKSASGASGSGPSSSSSSSVPAVEEEEGEDDDDADTAHGNALDALPLHCRWRRCGRLE